MFMQDTTAFVADRNATAQSLIARAARPLAGMLAGTLLESETGWRPVEDLARGDLVFTHDGGLREIRHVETRSLAPRQLIHVPGGTLGNCADMRLLPGQHVLLEYAPGERAFGSPWLLVPAAALVGLTGVRWQRGREELALYNLGFEEEEVVWANSGVLMHCPKEGAPQGASEFFKVLTLDQALALVALIEGAEAGRADLRAA